MRRWKPGTKLNDEGRIAAVPLRGTEGQEKKGPRANMGSWEHLTKGSEMATVQKGVLREKKN